jgi:two-component system cell cycle sensor histidine kinase/response regulator CckA
MRPTNPYTSLIIGILQFNDKFEVIAANPAAEQLLGFPEDELLGATPFNGKKHLLSGYQSPFTAENHPVVQAMETRQAVRNVITTFHKPNSEEQCWIRFDAVPEFPDGQSGSAQIILSLTDVTAQIQTQQALTESQNTIDSLFTNSRQGLIFVDPNGTITRFNRRFAEIIGAPAEGIAGTTMADALAPYMHYPSIREYLERVRNAPPGEVSQSYELRTDEFSCQAYFHKDSSTGKVIGFAKDVSSEISLLEQLEQQKRKLSDVIRGSGVGTWEWSVQSGETVFNERWAEIIGYTLAELEPVSIDTWIRFTHPDDLQHSNDALQEHFSGKSKVYHCEARMRHKDGSWVWVLDMGSVVSWSDDGKPLLMTGTHFEITERKEMEHALRQSETKFRYLFQSHSAVMLVIDPVSRMITDANQSAVDFYGWSRDELISMNVGEINIQSGDWIQTKMSRVLESGGETILLQHRLRNGEVRDVEVSAAVIEIDQEKYIYSVIFDVTGRLAAQRRLEQYNNMMQVLTNIAVKYINTPYDRIDQAIDNALSEIGEFTNGDRVVVFDYDFDAQTVSMRREWCAPGVNPDLGDAQDLPMDLFREWAEKHQQGEIVEIGNLDTAAPTPLMEHMKSIQVKSLIAVPMFNDTQCVGFVGISSLSEYRTFDQSQQALLRIFGQIIVSLRNRLRAEEYRELMEQQLRQKHKMEAVGLLAGGVAHDFNNLLTIILGYGEILKDGLENGQYSEEIEEVLSAAERAKQLTHQLLTFSRRGVIQPRQIAVDELIRDMTKMIKRLIPENIELHELLQSGDALIYADPGHMEQIVLNLVINARDAMPDGGTLTIDTEVLSSEDVAALLPAHKLDGRYLCLRVHDTGTGMDDETKAYIFDPFYTTKAEGAGTGMGLATVHGIVTQSNGVITVDSAPGKGSMFIVLLPLSQPVTESEDAAEQNGKPVLTGTECIMFIEDDSGIRRVMTTGLSRNGYQVLSSEDGESGFRLAKEHLDEIDVVVTDVIMPKLNGNEVVKELRSLRPDLNVIFCSGYSHDHLPDDILKDGQIRFLQKPFNINQLLHTIRGLLDAPGRSL